MNSSRADDVTESLRHNEADDGQLLQVIDLIFNCCLVYVFAACGLVGTAVNIFILSRYDITKDSSNILLVSLSIADFIYCLTITVRRCKCLVTHIVDVPTGLTMDAIMNEYFFIFTRMNYCVSITMVGAIAVERFLAVFYPFSTSRLLTPSKMKTVAISVYLVNVILMAPGFALFTHEWVYDTRYNRTVAFMMLTDLYRLNIDLVNFYFSMFYNTGLLGTSMFVTIICTVAIWVKIWTVTHERRRLTKRAASFDPRLAKILGSVCATSCVVYGPVIYFDTVICFIPNYIYGNVSYDIYVIIADFSGTLCATVNCVIYVTMSSKFKRAYKKLVKQLFWSNLCIKQGR